MASSNTNPDTADLLDPSTRRKETPIKPSDFLQYRNKSQSRSSSSNEDEFYDGMDNDQLKSQLRAVIRQQKAQNASSPTITASDFDSLASTIKDLTVTVPSIQKTLSTLSSDVNKISQKQHTHDIQWATSKNSNLPTTTTASSAPAPSATITTTTASSLPPTTLTSASLPNPAPYRSPFNPPKTPADNFREQLTKSLFKNNKLILPDSISSPVKQIEIQTKTNQKELLKMDMLLQAFERLQSTVVNAPNCEDILQLIRKEQDEQRQQLAEQEEALSRALNIRRHYDVQLKMPAAPSMSADMRYDFLHPKTIKSAIGIFDSAAPKADFSTCWKKILLYGNNKDFQEQDYINILVCIVKGPAETDLIDMVDRNASLEEILDYFAHQYTVRRTIAEDVKAVREFRRKPNEPIAACMARARHLTQRVEETQNPLIWPETQKCKLMILLKQVISPETRKYLHMKELEATEAGMVVSLNSMIKSVDIYETAHELIPQVEMSTSIQIANATPSTHNISKQSLSQEFSDRIESLEHVLLAALTDSQNSMKRARFEDPAAPPPTKTASAPSHLIRKIAEARRSRPNSRASTPIRNSSSNPVASPSQSQIPSLYNPPVLRPPPSPSSQDFFYKVPGIDRPSTPLSPPRNQIAMDTSPSGSQRPTGSSPYRRREYSQDRNRNYSQERRRDYSQDRRRSYSQERSQNYSRRDYSPAERSRSDYRYPPNNTQSRDRYRSPAPRRSSSQDRSPRVQSLNTPHISITVEDNNYHRCLRPGCNSLHLEGSDIHKEHLN